MSRCRSGYVTRRSGHIPYGHAHSANVYYLNPRPTPGPSFRLEVREYYATHRPEDAFDGKPRRRRCGRLELSTGAFYPTKGPFPVFPTQFDKFDVGLRQELFDYYEEEDKEDDTHLFTREETAVYNIPPRFLERRLKIYQITHVTSPTQFYMVQLEIGHASNNQHRKLPNWWMDLQTFYSDQEAQHELQFESSPGVSRVYVLWYEDLLCWERARVLTIDKDNRRCRVFFIDVGVFGDRSWKEFKQLVPDWAKPGPLAMAGKLQHVFPTTLKEGKLFNSSLPENLEQPSELWSQAAVTFMKKRAEGKFFYGINIPDTKHAITKWGETLEVLPLYNKFAMVFVELSLRSRKTLNAELCLTGNAICTGMGASSDWQFVSPHIFGLYNMPDIGDEMTNSPEISTVTPLERSLPYPNTIENVNDFFIWRVFGRANKEFNNKSEEYCSRIPELIRETMNLCDITAIISPACFYVLPASRLSALRHLTNYLNSQMTRKEWDVEQMPVLSFEIIVGMPVVLYLDFEDNEYFEGRRAWYRAVVKQVCTNLECVTAILVDFGWEVRARMVDVYAMPLAVQTIPAFCFRAHLNAPNYAPHPENVWSSDATETFRSCKAEWLKEEPTYYVWPSYPPNRVKLDVFNQSLAFATDGSCTWYKVPLHHRNAVCPDAVIDFTQNEIDELAGTARTMRPQLMDQEKLETARQEEMRRLISEFIRAAPGCQVIQRKKLEAPKSVPLTWINTPQFGALCEPLFTSIGVDFSYEKDGDELVSKFELFRATGTLGDNVKRQDEFDRMKFQAQLGNKIRIYREKPIFVYKYHGDSVV